MVNLNIAFDYADFVHCSVNWKQKDYLSPQSSIGFIVDGEGWFMLEGHKFIPSPGQMYFLPEGYKNSFSIMDENNTFKKYYCHFTTVTGAINVFNILKIPPCITPKNPKRIEQLFQEIIKIYRGSTNGILVLKIKTLLYELVYSYFESCGYESIKILHLEKHNHILLAPKYIQENLHKGLSVEEMACYFGYNSGHFSKLFKQSFKLTPLQYINKMRMDKSRLLISTTQMQISHISDMLGFENQYYFSNTFKNKFGMSPIEYRKIFIK